MAVEQVKDQRLRDMGNKMCEVDDLERTFASVLDQMKEVKKDRLEYLEQIETLKYLINEAEQMFRNTSKWPANSRTYVPLGRAFIIRDLPTIRKDFVEAAKAFTVQIKALKTNVALADYTVAAYLAELREITNENQRLRFEIKKIDENVFGTKKIG